MHFPKDIFREGLSTGLSLSSVVMSRDRREEEREDVQYIRPNLCSCRFDTFDDSLGKLLDVTVGRIEDQCDDWLAPPYQRLEGLSVYVVVSVQVRRDIRYQVR